MKNVEIKVEHGKMMIMVDLTLEIGPSASGKNVIIATTGGNVDVPGIDGAKIGLNVYRKNKK